MIKITNFHDFYFIILHWPILRLFLCKSVQDFKWANKHFSQANHENNSNMHVTCKLLNPSHDVWKSKKHDSSNPKQSHMVHVVVHYVQMTLHCDMFDWKCAYLPTCLPPSFDTHSILFLYLHIRRRNWYLHLGVMV